MPKQKRLPLVSRQPPQATVTDIMPVMIGNFRGRAKELRVISYLILALISLLIKLASLVFIFADDLTSSEVSVIDRQITNLIKDEGDLVAQLTPKLIQLVGNGNSVESIFSGRHISVVSEDEVGADENGLYNNYGFASPSVLSSGHQFKDFIVNQLHVDTIHDVSVFKIKISYSGIPDEHYHHTTLDGARFFWALRNDQVDKISAAIDAANLSDIALDKQALRTLMDKWEAVEAELTSLETQRKRALHEREGAEQTLKVQAGKLPGEKTANEEPVSIGHYLFQLNIRRFGTVGLITALIGVLTTFYRYTIRLSAYYTARADALVLQPVFKTLGFMKLSAALTPSIDFGKSDQLPLILELAKHFEKIPDKEE